MWIQHYSAVTKWNLLIWCDIPQDRSESNKSNYRDKMTQSLRAINEIQLTASPPQFTTKHRGTLLKLVVHSTVIPTCWWLAGIMFVTAQISCYEITDKYRDGHHERRAHRTWRQKLLTAPWWPVAVSGPLTADAAHLPQSTVEAGCLEDALQV